MNADRHPSVVISLLHADHVLRQVQPQYDLAEASECVLFHHGMNHVYRILSEQKRFYLRLSGNVRTKDQIEAEQRVLHDLVSAGGRVSAPVTTRNGDLLAEVESPEGTRFAALFIEAPGKALTSIPMTDPKNYRYAELFGRSAAQLHTALDSLPNTYDRPMMDLRFQIDHSIDCLKGILREQSDDYAFLTGMGEKLNEALADFPNSKPEFGICHGDLQPCNVHIDDSDNMTFFDLDDSGYTWRIYDLIYCSNQLSRNPQEGKCAWDAFLEGYSAIRPITEQELESLPLFKCVWMIYRMHWLGAYMTEHSGEGKRNGLINGTLSGLRRKSEELFS